MKTKNLFLGALALLFFSCSPTLVSNVESVLNPLGGKIEEAIKAWDGKKATKGEPDRSVDGTWLDVGIRYKYFILKDIINVKTLGEITGTPVFKSGPHGATGKIVFDSGEFGHYNPAFLTKVKNSLQSVTLKSTFNTIAQPYYDKELKNMARTYYKSYKYIKDNPDIAKNAGDTYDQEYFRSFADSLDKEGYDWYEAVTAPGFWVRRQKDGTMEQFADILEIVLNTYDKGFQQ